MTTLGLDLYAGNGDVDLRKAKTEDSIEYAIFKATEGWTFDDPKFGANWQKALDADVQPGAYHYARPDNNSAQVEADHFLRVLGDRRGILALDGEVLPKNWPLFELAAWYGSWLDIVARATGLTPFLYTYHRWVYTREFEALRSKWPLWIPLDPVTNKEVTQTAKVIGTLGTLDVDTYGGSLDELRAACGLTYHQPALPVAAPIPAPTHVPEDTDMNPIYRVTDGPAANAELYDYGKGPVHIDGPESQELTTAGIRVVPISGRTYARRLQGPAS